MHGTVESTAREFNVTRTATRANQCLTALAWMRGQEAALKAIVAEAVEAGGLRFVAVNWMVDEAGIRLALDTQAILMQNQKRSRWPVERVSWFPSSMRVCQCNSANRPLRAVCAVHCCAQ